MEQILPALEKKQCGHVSNSGSQYQAPPHGQSLGVEVGCLESLANLIRRCASIQVKGRVWSGPDGCISSPPSGEPKTLEFALWDGNSILIHLLNFGLYLSLGKGSQQLQDTNWRAPALKNWANQKFTLTMAVCSPVIMVRRRGKPTGKSTHLATIKCEKASWGLLCLYATWKHLSGKISGFACIPWPRAPPTPTPASSYLRPFLLNGLPSQPTWPVSWLRGRKEEVPLNALYTSAKTVAFRMVVMTGSAWEGTIGDTN